METFKPSVLLVEDDALTASLILFCLEREQWRTEHVPDGRAAQVRIASGEACDLVITEWLLPQVSGETLIANLSSSPEWRGTPVMVLGALDEGELISRVFDAGAADYVSKPFDPVELLARLRRLLRNVSADHVVGR